MATATGHDTGELTESSLKLDVETDLKGLHQGDLTAISHIVDLNMSLIRRITELESNYESVLSAAHACEERLGSVTREMDNLKYENSLLSNKLAEVDNSTRQTNLRVEGLLENENENIKENVASCLSRSGIICTVSDIDYAKRLGKYRQGQARPVLVRLTREGLRNAILYNRSNVSRNSNPPVWINDDISEVTRKQRKRTRDVASLAKMKGINVKVHSDGIIVGNEKYHHSDLDLLPQKFIQGEESPFSNFYPCMIADNGGQIFFSAEQLFQYRRAKSHGKLSIAAKMLKTRNNAELLRLAKKIQPSNEWRTGEEGFMADILMLKFTQNKDLGRTLINTGNRQLHEATGNRKWAVGFDISSKGLTENEWRGDDLLGKLLENTREAIRAVYGPHVSTSPILDSTQISQSAVDHSTIPLPKDDEEDDDEASDYEECPQPDMTSLDINQTTQSSADVNHTTQANLSPTKQEEGGSALDNQSHRETVPNSPHSGDVSKLPNASVTTRKNSRNPFRPVSRSRSGLDLQFSNADSIGSKTGAQQFSTTTQQYNQWDDPFDISGRQYSPRGPVKRNPRRGNRSRSQTK